MIEITFTVEAIADEWGYQFRARAIENKAVLWVKLPSLIGDQTGKSRNKRYSNILCDAIESGQKFSAKCEIYGDWHVIKEMKEIQE